MDVAVNDVPLRGAAPAEPPRQRAELAPGTRRASLALQGGGSHGAFTWGVLDALLEDGRIAIDGVSGSSAGAINGALLLSGFEAGGPEAARQVLAEFWGRVTNAAVFGPLHPSWLTKWMESTGLDAQGLSGQGFPAMDLLFRYWSPYQFNPFNYNPLRSALGELIDFERLRASGRSLLVGATDVRRGQLRCFRTEEMSVDVLLASTCLPFLFQAVEIDGNAYWDGGYLGNPPLTRLVEENVAEDILLVPINPMRRDELPTSAMAIVDRINEISFNAAYLSELNGIETINRLLRAGQIDPTRTGLREVRLHQIGDEAQMTHYSASSKLNPDAAMIEALFQHGRLTAQRFLDQHFEDVGVRTSCALEQLR
jgi:NTE family protein